MTSRSPWLRMLLEGVVIVLSILLAFGIQAWWDERGERQVELELLVSMLEAVHESQEELTLVSERATSDRDAVSRFYAAPIERLASVSPDSARVLLRALHRPNTFGAMAGPLAGTLNTAQLGLIRDAGVRRGLNEWLALATELEERNQHLAGLEAVGLVALGHHRVFGEIHLGSTETPNAPLDLRPVRDDVEVTATASAVAQARAVQAVYTGRLLDKLGELETLLFNLTS